MTIASLSVIPPTEVRLGDTIRTTYTMDGITTSRTGTVGIIREAHLSLRSAEDGAIWSASWGFNTAVIELLDRPKPPLPTETGSTIFVTRMAGYDSTCLHMFLRADKRWEVMGTGATYGAATIQDWKLTKLVVL